jgi:CRISPR-associated protein Cmr2
MNTKCYTVITFAPVQGFIEKSRKLRDLYGSSYILSFLSWIICQAAYKLNCSVVSPALPNVTQGMPNQIILEGNLSQDDIKLIQAFFNKAWELLADSCQDWIETHVPLYQNVGGNEQQWYYESWRRDWQLWKKYAWEFFSASGEPGESITQVRQRINQVKNSRDWTGINWQGESSTLSGGDAIAYPYLGPKLDPSDPDYQKKKTEVCKVDPRNYNYQEERKTVRFFYQQLSQTLGESFIKVNRLDIPDQEKTKRSLDYGSSFIDPREELSIPELIKRLITHQAIIEELKLRLRDQLKLEITEDETLESSEEDEDESKQKIPGWKLSQVARELKPDSFRELSREKDKAEDKKYWTGWFLGDGDGASKYFQSLKPEEEPVKIKEFSREMREWGRMLKRRQRHYLEDKGRMIYAGGDDFLGVLYDSEQQIPALECLKLFYTFKSEIWQKPQPKKISASVGFVWAGNQVPQRDVLQHCHAAESSAKSTGRDRIAFRILFNSGNYLEWVCPWWLLDDSDRQELAKKDMPILPEPSQNLIESYQDRDKGKNWTHFYQDVAILESRHAFRDKSIDIALGLI